MVEQYASMLGPDAAKCTFRPNSSGDSLMVMGTGDLLKAQKAFFSDSKRG